MNNRAGNSETLTRSTITLFQIDGSMKGEMKITIANKINVTLNVEMVGLNWGYPSIEPNLKCQPALS